MNVSPYPLLALHDDGLTVLGRRIEFPDLVLGRASQFTFAQYMPFAILGGVIIYSIVQD